MVTSRAYPELLGGFSKVRVIDDDFLSGSLTYLNKM